MQQLASRATFLVSVALALAISLSVVQASIDTEPVKVTLDNSGPAYLTINNEVEKVKPAEPQEATEQPQPAGNQDEPAQGHLIIRRIFLFPVRPSQDEQPFRLFNSADQSPRPSWHRPMRLAPTDDWPYFTRQPQIGEREEAQERPVQPSLIDPIQMMLTMIRQTIQAAAEQADHQAKPESEPETPSRPTSDFDKQPSSGADVFSSLLGISPNKTTTEEQVVEIDGKKYLRKMVINRHAGENIFFQTRRLALIPLDENGEPSTTTTTSSPQTSLAPVESETGKPKLEAKPDEPAISSEPQPSPAVGSSTTTTEQPSSTTVVEATSANQPSTAESETSARATEELTTASGPVKSTTEQPQDMARQKAADVPVSPSN